MLVDLHRLADSTNDPHDLHHVIAEWSSIGVVGGAFRLSEWAQDNTAYQKDGKRKENLDGLPTAFIMSDLVFFGRDGRRLQQSKRQILREADVHFVSFTWRTQKNGNNGETKKLARAKLPHLCAPRMALRIRNRAMLADMPPDHPLGVFVEHASTTPRLRCVTANDIDTCLRASAMRVFDLNPKNKEDKELLTKWSSHSTRVGACVALHLAGADKTMLMFRLRWMSDAHMVYLRDIQQLSQVHVEKIASLVDKCS